MTHDNPQAASRSEAASTGAGSGAAGGESGSGAAGQGPVTGPGKGGNIALWVLQVLLALVYAFSALGKFAGQEQVVQLFDAIGGDWLRYLVAVLEVAGAVGLLVPRLAGLAAVGFVGLMIGAVITHLTVTGSPVAAIVLGVLAAVVAWGRRGRTTELISAVTGR